MSAGDQAIVAITVAARTRGVYDNRAGVDGSEDPDRSNNGTIARTEVR